MSKVKRRRRGTAIVETDRGILLTAGRPGKPFILPGGEAKKDESRFVSALRELTEETRLLPYSARVIFRHKGKVNRKYGYQDYHTVCVVKATGTPRAGGGDAKRLGYYSPGCNTWISKTTKEIIERYYDWKKKEALSLDTEIIDEDDEVSDDVDECDVDDEE